MLSIRWARGRSVLILGLTGCLTAMAWGVPAPAPREDVIKERKGFIPHRKHQELAGTVVGILLADGQPVLSMEGRSGPPDQLCLGTNGGSYRWVYVAVQDGKPMIGSLNIPVGKGEVKRFDQLSLATPATVKQWGVAQPYSLVEVEVNAGLGSPAGDSFVATRIKVLDGSKEYPLKTAEVVADLKRRQESFLNDRVKAIEAALDEAQGKALKGRKPTGPREKSTVMYLTWLPETQRLRAHFLTRISDGAYSYGQGIAPAIDGGPARRPPSPPQAGPRFGTSFGIEFGVAFEVGKTGQLERTQSLPIESFQVEIPPPPAIRRPVDPVPPRR